MIIIFVRFYINIYRNVVGKKRQLSTEWNVFLLCLGVDIILLISIQASLMRVDPLEG
jgi:hypothetical protein